MNENDSMNDSDYTLRWRGLAAQLRELEHAAGIAGDSLASDPLEHGASTIEFDIDGARSAHSASTAPLGAAQRRSLRALYFAVPHLALRRSLIAKQRELELFERTGARTRLEEARRDLDSIRRRPGEGWWIAAIAGALLVIVGYELFAVLGAIAGSVAALFVGNGIEQGMRRRHEQSVDAAQDDVRAAVAAAGAAAEAGSLFSEREGATGEPEKQPAPEPWPTADAHALPRTV